MTQTNPALTADAANTDSIDQLNSFLRGEMAAVETYGIALDHLHAMSGTRAQLEQCRVSHTERVGMLLDKIRAMKGVPAESAGPWGVMTSAVELGASNLSESLAVTALEQGETLGLADYRRHLKNLSVQARELVLTKLLPRQEDTHRLMTHLKQLLSKA